MLKKDSVFVKGSQFGFNTQLILSEQMLIYKITLRLNRERDSKILLDSSMTSLKTRSIGRVELKGFLNKLSLVVSANFS